MVTCMHTPTGLRVLVEELPHTHSVSLGCYVNVGARYEPVELSGVSHFIEHMVFKGTRSFPIARSISEAVEGVGGLLNASTSYESTVYYAKVAHIHFDRALGVLSELLRCPLFDRRELEKERKVIIEELRGTQDAPSDWVHELLAADLWGNQPLGRDIAGSIESVSAIGHEELTRFFTRHYGIANTVISVAGNVDAERVLEQVSRTFADYAQAPLSVALPSDPARPGPQVRLVARDTEQGNFCLGLPGLAYTDPDRRALQVLDTVLGGGMTSRLFQVLREDNGLAYNVGSYHSEYADTGMWVIYGSVEADMLRDSLAMTFDILRAVASDGVTEEELALVKEQVKGGMLLSLEDTWSVAARNGAHLLRYDAVVPVEQVVAEVEAVSVADVARVAQRLIRSEQLHVAVVGDYDAQDEADIRTLVEAGL
ncbi:insulinase family protein [Candidatus Gracilibacteria bacterium]|nr:insulinase family protein [Candidatus Gracilibacteria bacterium]